MFGCFAAEESTASTNEEEVKPEKLEKEPAAPSVSDGANKYFLAPAVRAPQRFYHQSSLKHPQLADFHRVSNFLVQLKICLTFLFPIKSLH